MTRSRKGSSINSRNKGRGKNKHRSRTRRRSRNRRSITNRNIRRVARIGTRLAAGAVRGTTFYYWCGR